MKLKSYSSYTNQGPYLEINEDDVEVDLTQNLFFILDGFGGSGIGDKAVNLVKENIKKFYTKIGGDPDSTFPFYYSHKYLLEGNALLNSMHYAHTLLKKSNSEKEMASRAGASGIIAAQADNILTMVSTGNCMAYLFRKGKLRPLILPDSFESLSANDGQFHFSTTPTSGFGLFDELHTQVKELKVLDEDQVIFLTDGVYARLDSDEIRHILSQQETGSFKQAQELSQLANARGNMDNQSVLILHY